MEHPFAATMLDTYSHVTPGMGDQTAMEGALSWHRGLFPHGGDVPG
jgi:hypothetical protein